MTQEEKMMQMQKSFAFPRMMKMAGMRNWPNCPIPTTAQINEFIPEICGVPYDYLFRDDPVAMAECSCLVWEYLGLDSISGNLDIYNFEAECTGAHLRFYKDHIPDIDRSHPIIHGREDFDKIRYQGIQSGRAQYLVDYIKAMDKYTGTASFPILSVPWTLACNLYGLENLVIDTMEDPDFVHDLLHTIIDNLLLPMYRDLAEKLEMPMSPGGADALASQPLVNANIMTEFVEEAYDYFVKQAGCPVISSPWPVFHLMNEEDRQTVMTQCAKFTGNMFFFVFDPDPAELGVKYFREQADKRGVSLTLGFSSPLLLNGTKEDIVGRTKKYVLEGKAGMTPMMFMFNNIAPRTPVENIRLAMKAVEIYGAPGATWDTPFDDTIDTEIFDEFLKRKMENNAEGYSFDWMKMRK